MVERMISGFGDFTSSTDSQTSNAEEMEHCLNKCSFKSRDCSGPYLVSRLGDAG